MSKIIINNFGPISCIKFDLDKQFNVVIGAQASGKSTLAKCIYFFRKMMASIVKHVVMNYKRRKSLKPNMKKEEINILYKDCLMYLESEFIEHFGENAFRESCYLKYEYTLDKYVIFKFGENNEFSIRFSSQAKNILLDLISDIIKALSEDDEENDISAMSHSFLVIRAYQGLINDLFEIHDNIVYIPAGRSLIASLGNKGNIGYGDLDVVMSDFLKNIKNFRNIMKGENLRLIRNRLKHNNNNIAEIIDEYKYKILKGSYIIDEEDDFLLFEDTKKIPIINSSSGQQESLWILNLLSLAGRRKRRSFFVIEEPEAHLFPSAQLELIKFIVLIAKATNSEVLITTHSPYILTSLNLLLYSGKVEKKDSKKSIIPQNVRISPDTLGSYYLLNQTYENIFDEKEGLIKAEKIDVVSNCINEEFDKIMDLELSKL